MFAGIFVSCGEEENSAPESGEVSETGNKKSDEEQILELCRKANEANKLWIEFTSFGEGEYTEDGYRKPEILPEEKIPFRVEHSIVSESDESGNIVEKEIPDAEYRLVDEYRGLDEFKSKVLEYFSLNAAEKYFFKYFDEDLMREDGYSLSRYPYLIEVDGKLWVNYGFDSGDNGTYKGDSAKIKSLDVDSATVEITYRIMEDALTKEIAVVKENGRWVFDSLMF